MADDTSVPTSTNRLRIDSAQLTAAAGQPASQQSFTQKLIEVTIQLSPNAKTGQPVKFAGTNADTLTLSGFRMRVRIENSGGINARASVTIFGMNPSTMNQLATLGMIFDMVQKNSILISAGDANGLSPRFAGTIVQAFGYYNDLPNAAMHFECQVGQYAAIAPVAASSFPAPTAVKTIMSGLAALVPCGFENNGVEVNLPPSYFPGTARDQIRAVAEHAHINAEILPGSGGQQVLAIWPKGGYRTSLDGQNVPLISKTTGMIQSPAFAPNGFALVRTLFNPQIAFGGVVQVKSDVVPQASRAWVVQRLSESLDCYVPKGKWEQALICYPKGFQAPPPPQGSN